MSDQKKYTFTYSTFSEFERAYNLLKAHKHADIEAIKKRLEENKVPYKEVDKYGGTVVVDLANIPKGMSTRDLLNIEARHGVLLQVHEKLGIVEAK